MKKTKKITMLLFFVAIIGIQFFPTIRNENNSILDIDFMNTYNPPAEIAKTLRSSCYDCHSNSTKYPWYNKIQPVSWFLERHIQEAKKELNFSEFGGYSNRKQKSKLKSIINEIKNDKMPLFSYQMIHREAKITDIQKTKIIKWLDKLIQ